MKIYECLDQFKKILNAVVTIGTFDGVHVGHQKIFQRLRAIAQKIQGEVVLITFWPHPRLVLPLQKTEPIKLLTTFEEKMIIFAQQGIDHLLKIPFTKTFSQLSSIDFIQKILIEKIEIKRLVIGYDHRFGKNREGGGEMLKIEGMRYGFDVEEVPPQKIGGAVVSSTKIRNTLRTGKVNKASRYLGRPYEITGKVIKGNQIGRQMGFPTANLEILNVHKLIPADGAYAVKIIHEGTSYYGMLNIGVRPTIKGIVRTIEVYIINFKEKIYGHGLTIQFITQIRKESQFEDLNALKKQLLEDKKQALRVLEAWDRSDR